jgi:hypothetical protein
MAGALSGSSADTASRVQIASVPAESWYTPAFVAAMVAAKFINSLNDVRSSRVTKRFEIRVEEKTHIGADGTLVPAILDLVLGSSLTA